MNTFSRLTLTVLGCVALAAVPVTAFAAVASGFAVETVASGLNLPTAFLYTPDGEMLVAEKDGVVRLVENGVVRSTPVLTIQNVNTYADHGLIGIAYDETQHYLYALFTYENNPANPIGPKTGRLSRYTLDPTHTAIPGSEVVILGTVVGDALAPSCQSFPIGTDCIPSDEPSHSVADLGFGPDGKLYVSIGDGASFDVVDPLALRSQNLDMLSGKVLRINPDGSAPSDNPFYTGNANDNRSKVYAYGFRNPFRFSFRPTNQALIVGDVGWYTAEELNVITPGGNYGWPCHEGFNQAPGYNCVAQGSQDPLYAYFHDELGSGSITGGVFYTGGTYPSSYAGSYFFGDFSQDWVKHVVLDAENNLISVEDFVTEAGGPVDFAQDPQGNINYLSIYSGEVRRIIAVSGNRNPTVALSATPSNGLAPLSVQFSSDGSIDPDGDTISYSWDFGDGVLSSLSAPTHVYNANGVYQAVLTVSDGNGGSASKSLTVTVGNRAPTATIVNPPANSFYTGGQLIPLVSSATDPEDGALPASAYRWTVILHHNVHYHILEYLTGPNPSFVAPSHGTDQDVHIEIQLRVVDSGGLAHIVTRHFYQAPPATVSPFHISSTADAASVGMPVRISTELGNSGGTAPFLVDLELFDAAGTRVAQTFYDGVAIPTGGTSTYTMTYTPVTSGPYRLAVGLIYAGWQGLYQWVDNALTFIASSLWTPTAPNGALSFDGVDDYIETELWNIEEPNGFTLEARMIPEAFNGDQYIMSKAIGDTDEGIDWAFGIRKVSDTEGTILFRLRTDQGGLTTLTGGNIGIGEYVHASVVYNGTTMEVFKNGVSVGSVPKTGIIATGPHHVFLGARADAVTNPFHGRIDEIRVWNEPQSVQEINQWKDGELTQKENGLIKDWRFNEGFGQIVIDSSNSGHHGTLGSVKTTVDANDPTRLAGKYPTGGTFLPVLGTVIALQNPLPLAATTSIQVPVTNTGDGSGFMIVNVEVYDPSGNRITQQYFDGEGFAPGESRIFTVPFAPTTLGHYRVAVGLVHLFWTDVYSWTNDALTISVSNVVLTPFALTHTSTTITDPSTGVGDSATWSTTVTNTGTMNGAGVIDFEVFNASGAQVYQQFYQNEPFAGGESRTFTGQFTPTVEGTYRIAVGLIHENWSGLYQWANDVGTMTLGGGTGSTTSTIFDEALAPGWQDWSWGTTVTTDASPAYQGTKAMGVTYTSVWGGLYLHHNGYSTQGKQSLVFSLRAQNPLAPTLQVTAFDASGNPLPSIAIAPYLSGSMNDTGYVQVSIPLSVLSVQGVDMKGLMIQGATGNIEPAFLIDNITIE